MTSGAEIQLVHEVAREFALGRVLQPVIPDYDVILIDCQPSLGLLTVNALACADSVLVPLQCEYFALRGAALLVETIDKVPSRLRTSSHCRRPGWPRPDAASPEDPARSTHCLDPVLAPRRTQRCAYPAQPSEVTGG